MQAQELRVGNLIESNGCIYEVISIDNKGNIKGIDSGTSFNLDKCVNPITLTEEWLFKFGFIKVNDYYITIESFHYEYKNCWIYLFKKVFEFELITSDGRFNLHKAFKYVHQLQNLYFAINGEELTLNT